MGIIQKIGEKRFAPGKGVKSPSPQKGIRRFFFLFGTYFWRLLGINFLFVLCCLPLITIPASICALNRYTIKMVRDGYGFSVADYWKEWKAQLVKSILVAPVSVLPLALGYYLLNMYASGFGGSGVLAAAIFWLAFGLVVGSYVFMLLAMLDLPLQKIVKTAFLLIILDWKESLGVLLLTMFTLVAAGSAFPLSVLILGGGWFAWLSLALGCIINGPVQKRIFTPYQEQLETTPE